MEFVDRDAELLELDLVAPDPDDAKRLLVAEVKWRRLSVTERKNVLCQLESKWSRCSLRARYRNVRFEVLDARVLVGRDSGASGRERALAQRTSPRHRRAA